MNALQGLDGITIAAICFFAVIVIGAWAHVALGSE